jgi:ankyrin repeat protein
VSRRELGTQWRQEHRTPVWVAAYHCHTDIVWTLVKWCADAQAADKGGLTPVWVAAYDGHTETVRALCRSAAPTPTLPVKTAALPSGSLPGMATRTQCGLCWCGADPDTTCDGGCTPVWIAAQEGHTHTVRALVECGADANTPNNSGCTPVSMEASEGDAEMIWTLVRCRANWRQSSETAATGFCQYDETNPRPRAATTPDVLDHGDATRLH